MSNYVVATIKPWNISAFERYQKTLAGDWHLISDKDALSPELISELKPRYIFFPHWSWIVPDEILSSAECVCFHMTDLPYGRGGTPLQNLILRGHKETKISALKMTGELDGGPIYQKTPLSLEGRAEDIYKRMSEQIADMIAFIVKEEPTPKAQEGEVVTFERRTPEQSALPDSGSLEQLYDHIRMLDAETYPQAFIEHGNFRLQFKEATLSDGTITATVVINDEPKN